MIDIPHCPEHPDAGLRLLSAITEHQQYQVTFLPDKGYYLGDLKDKDIIKTEDLYFLCAACAREIDIPEDWEEVF